MKTFLYALCVLALTGCAQSQRTHSQVMNSLPPIIRTLPVDIVPSTRQPALAWSTAGMMEKYISYNPRIAAKLPTGVLAFALVHEYAHLHLNHIAPFESPKSPGEVRQRELEADRFAAKFWSTNDANVARAAASAFLSRAGQRALGSEKRSLQLGYPSREKRAKAILDALAESPQAAARQNED